MKKFFSFFSGVFINDWKSKVLAFLLACVVWYYATTEVTGKISERVAIEIKGQSPDLMVILSTKEVEITLGGPQQDLTRFALKPLAGSLSIDDFQQPKSDKIKLKIATKKFFKLPDNIYFVGPQKPKFVDVTIINAKTKLLEIKPIITMPASDDYIISKIKTTPSLVMVEGPKKDMATKQFVYTNLVYLPRPEKRGLLHVPTKLEVADQFTQYRTTRDIMIEIKIDFKERFVTRSLPVKLRYIANIGLSKNFTVLSKIPKTIDVKGREDILNKYRTIEGFIDLNETKVADGKTKCSIRFFLPPTLEILPSFPKEVLVQF